ncbi:MAG: hypothetical protein DRN04_05030 [Thermoprotei archaeon]|nr:MAG: hypothetical protein DRN04_05030 [Thermoprotei archaeon]
MRKATTTCTLLIVFYLLLLTFTYPSLVSVSIFIPQKTYLKPSEIFCKIDLSTKVNLGRVYVKISLQKNDHIYWSVVKQVYLNNSTESISETLYISERDPPGEYRLKVEVLSGGRVLGSSFKEILIAPTQTDLYLLLSKYVTLKAEVEDILEEETPLALSLKSSFRKLSEKLSSAFRAYKENNISKSAIFYQEAENLLNDLERKITISQDYILLHKLFSAIDKSLSYDPYLVYSFWLSIASLGTFIFMLIFFIVFPLYVSSTDSWTNNIVLLTKRNIVENLKESVEAAKKTLLEKAKEQASLDIRTLILASLSALMATVGLLMNNTVTVIGAMIIAPLLSVSVYSTFDWLLLAEEKKEGAKYLKSLKNEFILVALVVIESLLIAKISSMVIPLSETPLIMERARPNFADLVIAVGSGLAAVVSLIGGKENYAILVGAAIAIALVPPASTIGIGLALKRADIALGALSLLIANLLAIKLSAYLAARIYVLLPVIKIISQYIRGLFDINEADYLKVLFTKILTLVKYWVNVSLNIETPIDTQIGSFKELVRTITPYIKNITSIFLKYIVLPVTISASICLTLSLAEISFAVSYMLSIIDQLVSQLMEKIGVSTYAIAMYSPTLSIAVSALLVLGLAILLVKIASGKKQRKAAASALLVNIALWGSLAILLKIYYFSRVALLGLLLNTIFFAGAVLWKKLRKYKSHVILYSFVIFMLAYITLQSLSVYETVFYTRNLSEVSHIVRTAAATYFNVSESRILVSVSFKGKQVDIVIHFLLKQSELSKQLLNVSELNEFKTLLTDITGYRKIDLRVDYIIIPG